MKTLTAILFALAVTGCATQPDREYSPEERAAAISAILGSRQPFMPSYTPPNAISQPVYRAPVQRTVVCHRVGGVVQCF